MKPPPSAENVALVNNIDTNQTGPCNNSLFNRGTMLLTEVHDQEVLRLPAIHPPAKPQKAASVDVSHTRSLTVSRGGHNAKIDSIAKTTGGQDEDKCSMDLYELKHSLDDLPKSPKNPDWANGNVTVCCEMGVKKLVKRAHKEHAIVRKDSEVNGAMFNCRADTQGNETRRLLPFPNRPYLKSHSQRELTLEEKEGSFLPDIFLGSGPIARPSKPDASTGTAKASSIVSVLPALPSKPVCSKSVSQPNIFKPASPTPSPEEPPNLSPSTAKKRRIRNLWKTAGEKLGICMDNVDVEETSTSDSWVCAPGAGQRPLYSRWCNRRHALAEPERMCMPQVLRERIQRDVESRRRSMKRRVSKFLNARLGFNLEEDLGA